MTSFYYFTCLPRREHIRATAHRYYMGLIIPRLIIIILRILITIKVIFVIVIEILRIVIVVDVIKIIPFRTGCWSRCLPFAGNYGVMSAKPWRSAAGAAVTGFGRRGIDNRVIFQQNIILQFSVKLVCQSVIACVCYRKRIFMETM